MSIWTCKRALFGLVAALAVSGCEEGTGVSGAGFGVTRSAPQTVAVSDRAVVIGGPSGYCIDRPGSRLSGESAFVVLASCASITRNPQNGVPGVPGLLTASVAREGAGPGLLATPGTLESYLASGAGRAAMARDGRSGSVTILDMMRADGAVLIRLRDTSQPEQANVGDTYWRGLTDLNGRLVTISVLSFADTPMPPAEGLRTLRVFLTRIRAESPVQVAVN